MRWIRRRILGVVVLLSLIVSLLVASTPKLITLSSQKDFEEGEPKGVSISHLGEISLAPQIKELFKTETPFIWAGTGDSQGNLFVAGGSTGEVFKIDRQNNNQSFFDSEDQQIYDLKVDKQNNLYVATSPEGRVYRIPSSGPSSGAPATFFDPEEVYIWSMAFDERGNLYVATGEKGNIYRVDTSGKHSLFYESDDAHVRKLILDANGSLVAGTSGKGLILRVGSSGDAFVLYDSPLIEITDLLLDSRGRIYASAAGESRIQRLPPGGPPSSQGAEGEVAAGAATEEATDLPQPGASGGRGSRFGKQTSEVYRLEATGTVRTVWQSRRERIFAMLLDESNRVILGTGEPGRLYFLNEGGDHTLLSEFEELQVTALGRDSGGQIFVCTSNTGRVYRLSQDYNSSAEYLSDVIDATVISTWGELHWEADVPAKTTLAFHSRSGNTEEPDKSWSPWSQAYSRSEGQAIESPPARFVQLKAALSTRSSQHSPVLKEMTFSYLQANVEPQITEITVHPPGDYYPESANNRNSDSHIGNGQAPNQANGQSQLPGRKTFIKGSRSISWKTKDDNGDELSFDLFYKGTNEKSWKALVEDFHGYVFSWDSELFPDGRYLVKILAKDDPSNPPAMSLSSEKISQPFKVDNTGPRVSEIKVTNSANQAKIVFSVEDEMSNVTTVEYGLNAEKWKLVYPIDGICDSKKEQFEITVRSHVKGENTIVIKAKDALGNIGFGKANVAL